MPIPQPIGPALADAAPVAGEPTARPDPAGGPTAGLELDIGAPPPPPSPAPPAGLVPPLPKSLPESSDGEPEPPPVSGISGVA
ncbi:hypothetical protein [Candidatus Mycolicibacterium alkanivorans]|uniref:Uncharacterized protein n=1 Tax=Candidatus Mycolicibacterium alkanivorans TaxID=2954114 RepID=A0ABS9YX82_9MYCO|nr:hypothetical protein [Candidatus Mycolicibacterium alkanivorans]MCI4675851.1 hypothetical protein [Candidatus Mycolicibacterium alkanivorans]